MALYWRRKVCDRSADALLSHDRLQNSDLVARRVDGLRCMLAASTSHACGAVMAVNARRLTPPLCVDLDGTLIRSDLLLESLVLLLKRNPLYLFVAVMWLLRGGKAALKAEIASRVTLNAAALPYNNDLIAWIRAERATGREVWLCTAANERLANQVAEHVGLFDDHAQPVIHQPTSPEERKAEQYVERFGADEFGPRQRACATLAIWRRARSAIVVNGSAALERQASAEVTVDRVFPATGGKTYRAIVRAVGAAPVGQERAGIGAGVRRPPLRRS